MFSLTRSFDSYYTSSTPRMAIELERHCVFQLRPAGITTRWMIAAYPGEDRLLTSPPGR